MKNNHYIVVVLIMLSISVLAQDKKVIDPENVLTKKENLALEKALQYEADFFNRLFFDRDRMVSVSDIKLIVAKNFLEYLYIQSEYEFNKRNITRRVNK
jgi:hypothetical protein